MALGAGLIVGLMLAVRPACVFAQHGIAQPVVEDARTPGRPGPADSSDILPFARNPLPATFPSVGLSLSYAGFLSGFETVEEAFRSMENFYRGGGYPVPQAAPVEPGPLLLSTLELRLNERIDVALQAGRAGSQVDEFKLLGARLSGRFTPTSARNLSLRAAFGAGVYGFKFERRYAAQISAPDANGGYYRLEQVVLDGGGRYWSVAGGLVLRSGPRGAFEAFIQYLGTGNVATSTSAGEVSLNLSGAMIGGSFTLFF